METIILNEDNCKEYTEAEMIAKIEAHDSKEEAGFDLDILFSDDVFVEEVEVKELTAFQILTLSLLETAKKEFAFWDAKSYKGSSKSVFVGDEVGGSYYNVGTINHKRKMNGMRGAEADIKLYTKDLINSGYEF